MKDRDKTREELINELTELRRRIAGLENSEAMCMSVESGLSEIFDALQKISSGDPTIRIDETADVELISKLKRLVNLTAQSIAEIVDLSHEFAMVLAEHFDVLQRVSKGDLSASVTGSSQIELLESFKKVTNRTIESISKEIAERKKAEKSIADALNFNKTILESSPVGIITYKSSGDCISANEAAARMVGATTEQLLLQNFRRLESWKQAGMTEAADDALKAGTDRVIDTHFVTTFGKKVCFLCRFVPFQFGEEPHLLLMVSDISERKKAEEELKRRAEQIRMLLDSTAEAIYGMDLKGNCTFVNAACLHLIGYDRETELIGKNMHDLIHYKYQDGSLYPSEECRICKGYKEGRKVHSDSEVFWRSDGTSFPVEYWAYPVRENEKIVGSVVTFLDITERNSAAMELEQSERKLRSIIEHSNELFYSHDIHHRLTYVSPQSLHILGYAPEEMMIEWTKLNTENPINEKAVEYTEEAIRTGVKQKPYLIEVLRKDGKKVLLEVDESPVKDKEGNVKSIVGAARDVTEHKRMEERIEYLAYYDGLTGLPNRNLFFDRLTQGLSRAEYDKKIVSVLAINIDRFKYINDTYGITAGDAVLKELASRLSVSVRDGDTVARLGNDDFGILLIDIAQPEDIIRVIEKIMRNSSQPMLFQGKEILITLSAGISVFPTDGGDASSLIKNADLALAKAKQEGRKDYQFYTEGLDVKASEFVLMEKNLFNAVKNQEFILHYQPFWDINTKKIAGIEALIRWRSPESGLVPPGKFIPVLEDTRLIIEVGEWILRTAISQVKKWQNEGLQVVPVSVNLSLIQFRQKDLHQMIERVIRQAGFYPSLLMLEITESAFMQDMESASLVLKRLKDIGITISIDDFGTGYSSLSYLKRLPIDNLKIDMSFIREMVLDADSASLVMAIINMAHTLNLKTIAEGIETEEQWKFLRLLRCDMGQGFYFSKPLPAEEVEKFFRQQ